MDHPAGTPNGMGHKCSVAVEKWMVLTLEDFHFSPEFKNSCGREIKKHCKVKYEIIKLK